MPDSSSVRAPKLNLALRSAGVLALLLVFLAALLINSAREESQTFDESTHLGAGFWYWHHGDFEKNPEHPPLVKMLAALPLLSLGLKEPPPTHIPFFKGQDAAYGTGLMYAGGADWSTVLFRGRLVMMLFSLGLGLLLWVAAQELFGPVAAACALCLYVFQPLLLGNGNVVTTDMALACFLFASVFTFYRFCNRPTPTRFALCAFATCLTIDCKHSGVLVLPILCLLALADRLLPATLEPGLLRRRRHTGTILLALCGLFLLGYLGLWATYGFKYGALHITPPLAAYAAGIAQPFEARLILFLDAHHLFPEPYLYGWVDILRIPSTRPSFLFGTVYDTPTRLFFPAAFLIKSTLALLVFLLLLPFARIHGQRRTIVFFATPALFFLAVAIFSMMNGGARYLLPVYPYAVLLAGAAAAAFFARGVPGKIAVAALMLSGVVSTLHSYPDFLAYSNELFGGPAHTYMALTDPDADWGQGLRWTSAYMAQHPDHNCWFDYYGNSTLDTVAMGTPCKPLLSSFHHLTGNGTPPIATQLSGTFLVSSSDLDGPWWGPGNLNPYQPFKKQTPDASIGNIILVYHGSFNVPLLAAETNAVAATACLRQNRLPEALVLAQTAVSQAPDTADVQEVLGEVLLASGRIPEGQQTMARALNLAQTNYPGYQRTLIDEIEHPAPHP